MINQMDVPLPSSFSARVGKCAAPLFPKHGDDAQWDVVVMGKGFSPSKEPYEEYYNEQHEEEDDGEQEVEDEEEGYEDGGYEDGGYEEGGYEEEGYEEEDENEGEDATVGFVGGDAPRQQGEDGDENEYGAEDFFDESFNPIPSAYSSPSPSPYSPYSSTPPPPPDVPSYSDADPVTFDMCKNPVIFLAIPNYILSIKDMIKVLGISLDMLNFYIYKYSGNSSQGLDFDRSLAESLFRPLSVDFTEFVDTPVVNSADLLESSATLGDRRRLLLISLRRLEMNALLNAPFRTNAASVMSGYILVNVKLVTDVYSSVFFMAANMAPRVPLPAVVLPPLLTEWPRTMKSLRFMVSMYSMCIWMNGGNNEALDFSAAATRFLNSISPTITDPAKVKQDTVMDATFRRIWEASQSVGELMMAERVSAATSSTSALSILEKRILYLRDAFAVAMGSIFMPNFDKVKAAYENIVKTQLTTPVVTQTIAATSARANFNKMMMQQRNSWDFFASSDDDELTPALYNAVITKIFGEIASNTSVSAWYKGLAENKRIKFSYNILELLTNSDGITVEQLVFYCLFLNSTTMTYQDLPKGVDIVFMCAGKQIPAALTYKSRVLSIVAKAITDAKVSNTDVVDLQVLSQMAITITKQAPDFVVFLLTSIIPNGKFARRILSDILYMSLGALIIPKIAPGEPPMPPPLPSKKLSVKQMEDWSIKYANSLVQSGVIKPEVATKFLDDVKKYLDSIASKEISELEAIIPQTNSFYDIGNKPEATIVGNVTVNYVKMINATQNIVMNVLEPDNNVESLYETVMALFQGVVPHSNAEQQQKDPFTTAEEEELKKQLSEKVTEAIIAQILDYAKKNGITVTISNYEEIIKAVQKLAPATTDAQPVAVAKPAPKEEEPAKEKFWVVWLVIAVCVVLIIGVVIAAILLS